MNRLLILVALLGAISCSNVNRHTRIMDINNSIESKALRSNESHKAVSLSVRLSPLVAHKPGTSVELTCEAYGSPAPSIHWYKNDAPVYEHDLESNELIDPNPESLARVVSTLFITKTDTEDQYRCVVRSGGKVKSATSTVYRSNGDVVTENPERARLYPLAPRILATYKVYVDVIGNSAILPCRVRGHPKPHITWTHKTPGDSIGTVLKNDSRMKILRSGELMLSPLHWEDLGEFTCTAINIFGSVEANTFVYPAKAG